MNDEQFSNMRAGLFSCSTFTICLFIAPPCKKLFALQNVCAETETVAKAKGKKGALSFVYSSRVHDKKQCKIKRENKFCIIISS